MATDEWNGMQFLKVTDLISEQNASLPIPEHYLCTLCFKIAICPVMCTDCLKLFCKHCIDPLDEEATCSSTSGKDEQCPNCDKPWLPESLDPSHRLFQIEFTCPACTTVFSYREPITHLLKCPSLAAHIIELNYSSNNSS